ncbi:MAG: hypothetical protein N2249_03780 [Melioribacter sp.]|nr:hypothetical protein [Melioribacter sp.]
MKTIVKFLSLISLFFLGGCYTQLALRDYNKNYEEEYTYYDSREDTAYNEVKKEVNIYNYYGFYPNYRRYYWGYYPGFSITIDAYYYDPFWWDFYYPYYYPWWYYPYPYSYWVYKEYWYYHPYYWHYGYKHYGNIYKYRQTYTHLRNLDGGRNLELREGDNDYRTGRTNIIRGNSFSRPNDVDLSRTGVSRDRNNSGRLTKDVPTNSNAERKNETRDTKVRYPTEITRDRETRGSDNPERNRGESSNREKRGSGGDNSRTSSEPSYTPPRGDTHSSPSYNPPPRPSSGSGSSRGNDGGRSSGGDGRRR